MIINAVNINQQKTNKNNKRKELCIYKIQLQKNKNDDPCKYINEEKNSTAQL